MYVKGLVQDVTNEAEKYKGHFSGAYGQMSVGGKVVGLPQDTGPLVYVYNEAEFKGLVELNTTVAVLPFTFKLCCVHHGALPLRTLSAKS